MATQRVVNHRLDFWCREQHDRPQLSPTLTLFNITDFTLAPLKAQTMAYLNGMMRNPYIGEVSSDALHDGGFDGWWNPVEKLLGTLEWRDGNTTFLCQTSPWDGAPGVRIDTIIKHTDGAKKKRVRDFFS